MNDQNLTPTATPVVQDAVVLMSFYDALKKLSEGKRIARLEWHNADYGILRNGFVAIFRDGKMFDNWLINDGDLMGEDWMVLPDLN